MNINPYLIQRLQKPIKTDNEFLKKLPEVFSFGGGLIRGGFTKEGWRLLTSVFRFDYMGSAEFEWGGVPRAFEQLFKLREEDKLCAGEIKIKDKFVFYISPIEFEKEVVEYINLLAEKGDYYKKKGDRFGTIWLKESTYLKKELESKEQDSHSISGWIDLDNYFMFFIDKEMFENTLKVFGLNLQMEEIRTNP